MTSPTPPTLDLDRLLKLRPIVARFGEADLAKGWNTKGQPGRLENLREAPVATGAAKRTKKATKGNAHA